VSDILLSDYIVNERSYQKMDSQLTAAKADANSSKIAALSELVNQEIMSCCVTGSVFGVCVAARNLHRKKEERWRRRLPVTSFTMQNAER
jgi:hypothetical protein